MNKNTKAVWLTGIAVLLLGVVLFLARDLYLTGGKTNCGDPEGPRPQIDLRRFETHYTEYSLSLEAEVTGKGKFVGKLEPAVLQKLSESIQTGQEFRKALVAGYNACAVTRTAYQSAVLRFQALDGLARQIDAMAGKRVLSKEDQSILTKLIEGYSETAQKLGGGVK